MRQLLTVTKTTYMRQIKSWAFVAMVMGPILTLLLSFGGGYLSSQSAFDETADVEVTKIALITEDDKIKAALKPVPEITLRYDNQSDAQKAIDKEKILGYVLVDQENQVVSARYYGAEALDPLFKMTMLSVLEEFQDNLNLTEAKLSRQQVAALGQKMRYTEKVTPLKNSNQKGQEELKKLFKYIALTVLVLFTYMMLIFYASSTAQEIASEKGTKIMEMIFSSLPASQYFFGRILGIFAVLLTHISIYLVGLFGFYQLAQALDFSRDWLTQNETVLKGVLESFSPTMVLFALFGILFYVTLSAMCGTLVTRPEDANKAVQPVLFLVLFAFFGAFYLGQGHADHLLFKLGTYFPVTSIFFMPVRMINSQVAHWEVGLSLGLLCLSTCLLIGFVAKSYAGLVLQTDDLSLWKSFKRGLANK